MFQEGHASCEQSRQQALSAECRPLGGLTSVQTTGRSHPKVNVSMRQVYERLFTHRRSGHVDWVNSLKALVLALAAYVRDHHAAGPAWNPGGGSVAGFKGARDGRACNENTPRRVLADICVSWLPGFERNKITTQTNTSAGHVQPGCAGLGSLCGGYETCTGDAPMWLRLAHALLVCCTVSTTLSVRHLHDCLPL